ILDLGTGTGAIALAVLANVAEAQATGTDISAQALETARANAERAGLSDRFTVLRSDWFDAVGGRFDIIVSNPPYIASAEIEALAADVRLHDPRRALDGGADGLDAYRCIARDAKRFLTEKGHVALETGYDQKQAVSALFTKAGYQVVQTVRDLGGNDRVIVFA
ncbi:MAG: peptide chain release factor N(5)-glutamine methyltransferase, partial [Brucellaceae bacterium]|nr:peptide chain release factor N(5)-glutamine methyltransferase [Brucellaceae bacterium]